MMLKLLLFQIILLKFMYMNFRYVHHSQILQFLMLLLKLVNSFPSNCKIIKIEDDNNINIII